MFVTIRKEDGRNGSYIYKIWLKTMKECAVRNMFCNLVLKQCTVVFHKIEKYTTWKNWDVLCFMYLLLNDNYSKLKTIASLR